MKFQLALNKTFCPNPQPLTHGQLKQGQETKTNKTMLSAFCLFSSVFHTMFTVSELKNNYSILTINELGTSALQSSGRVSKFYAPTDSKQKFNEKEIGNELPIGCILISS